MLALTRIQRQAEWRKYLFEEYSRPDYLARSVTILVDAAFIIQALRFNSSRHGLVHFSRGRGITESLAWQDETQSRAESGHGAYYHMDSVAPGRANVAAVIDDVLSAAPNETFRRFTGQFVEHSTAAVRYPFEEFRLTPVETFGQVHLVRFIAKSQNDREKAANRSVLRSLNPVFAARGATANVRESLDRMVYTCTACGAENRLLDRACRECEMGRPRLGTGVVLRVFLQALVSMSYALYVVTAVGFLFFALLQAGKTYQQLR